MISRQILGLSCFVVVISTSFACGQGGNADAPSEDMAVVQVNVLDLPYLQQNVGRVASLTAQGDEIFVLDKLQNQLHRLSSSGGTTLLRSGQGPGEIGEGGMGTVTSYSGDSLLVYDGGNQRVFVFHPEAPVAGRVVDMGPGWSPGPDDTFAALDDGRILQFAIGSEEWNGVILRDQEGAVLDTVLALAYQRPPAVVEGVPVVRILPNQVVWTMGDDENIIVGTSDGRQLHRVDPNESSYESLNAAIPRAEVSAGLREDMEAFWAERAAMEDMPENLISMIELITPDSLPLVSGVIPLPDEAVLVQGPPSEGQMRLEDLTQSVLIGAGGTDWTAIGRDGQVLGQARLSHRFVPIQIEEDSLLGVTPGGLLGVQIARVARADLVAALREMSP